MTRAFRVAAIALAIAGAAACGKKGGAGTKTVGERELVPVTNTLQKLSITLSLPKGLTGGPKDMTTLHWNEGAGDTLDVEVRVVTPVAMQNELNETASMQLRVTRSDELPDGWSVTAATADGTQTRNRRLVKVTDNQAVLCTTVWEATSKKSNEWVESFCKSLTVEPQ